MAEPDQNADDETRPETEAVAPRPPWKRVVLLAVAVCVLLVVGYLSPLRDYFSNAREISEHIRSFGIWSPLVFTILVAGLVAGGFPRLLLCVISGMAFGFWWGLFWAQLGTLVGNYAVFLVGRAGGGTWVQHYLSRKGATLKSVVKQEGLRGVLVARQLPVPGLAVNLTCALLGVRQRDYLVGTLVGQLPEAIPCTLIGAGALKPTFGKSAVLIGAAVAAAVVLWAVVQRMLRTGKNRP